MFSKIKEYFRKWFSDGVMLPLIYDPISKAPSVTLTCVYISFFWAIKALWDFKAAPTNAMPSILGMIFWALAMTFYLIRKIGKAKFDLANKSMEFDNGDDADKASDTTAAAKTDNPDN
jgi:hypothetical protein